MNVLDVIPVSRFMGISFIQPNDAAEIVCRLIT